MMRVRTVCWRLTVELFVKKSALLSGLSSLWRLLCLRQPALWVSRVVNINPARRCQTLSRNYARGAKAAEIYAGQMAALATMGPGYRWFSRGRQVF